MIAVMATLLALVMAAATGKFSFSAQAQTPSEAAGEQAGLRQAVSFAATPDHILHRATPSNDASILTCIATLMDTATAAATRMVVAVTAEVVSAGQAAIACKLSAPASSSNTGT